MSQEEINTTEWREPSNWAQPRWLGLYFSKKDTRTWVPKPAPLTGWTVNLAQPGGALSFVGIIGVVIVLVGFIAFAATR